MPDMLVKLYELPDYSALVAQLRRDGVDIRRAIPPEKHLALAWVERKFGVGWASECDKAFSNTPVSCFIAVTDGQMLGFACYDATCPDFFGPTGVAEAQRLRGIGKALLWMSLRAMAELGYGYAVIGSAGPTAYYEKAVGAVAIPDSSPGIYRGMLQPPRAEVAP